MFYPEEMKGLLVKIRRLDTITANLLKCFWCVRKPSYGDPFHVLRSRSTTHRKGIRRRGTRLSKPDTGESHRDLCASSESGIGGGKTFPHQWNKLNPGDRGMQLVMSGGGCLLVCRSFGIESVILICCHESGWDSLACVAPYPEEVGGPGKWICQDQG